MWGGGLTNPPSVRVQLKVLDAKPGRVWAEMDVQRHQKLLDLPPSLAANEHTDRNLLSSVNRLQGLHGGVIASLVDTMGSLALASRGLYMTGVSIDMSQTFVRGAKLGQTVRIQSELVNMGKTLAYTRVELHDAESGKLLAYAEITPPPPPAGSHTKYIADALKSDKNVKFSEDGEAILEGSEPTE
ncbi:hypothetical protein C6P46_006228 [Rhodotorula mucilaginosa]|uniref:Thioesterase domain-containing protein n=1 Tax=Rhodotorula mucilaginosa TaxID=5537 RepID=A0A9P6VYK2_RHOMI|nr:hypothetical protein C6P46_006228 [Rhodotorula mucilaginosa]